MSVPNGIETKSKNSRKSPNRVPSGINSPSEQTNPLITSNKQTIKSNSHNGYNSRNGIPSTNTTQKASKSKPIIDIFRANFEGNFAKHDELEGYKVRKYMVEPYIISNENLKLNYKLWLPILQNYRFLLYLDQFINFINSDGLDLSGFVANDKKKPDKYYELQIANSTVITAESDEVDKISQIYSSRIYKETEQINNTYISKQPNLTGINLTYSHGGYHKNLEILVVPDNVIIAFIKPLNKYGYQIDEDHKQVVYTLNEYKDNIEFLKNPACYLRNNMCFNNATYYYPGQKILNYDLSINKNKDINSMGFYNITTSNKDIPLNIISQLFNTSDNINYSITFKDIFTEKYEMIKNKILFVDCCRKCDRYLNSKQIEFLYRYEHIITYLNMSKCNLELKDKSMYKCMSDKGKLGIAANTAYIRLDPNLFYDSALSYDFKDNYTKKIMLYGFNGSNSSNNINSPSISPSGRNRVNASANNTIKLSKLSKSLQELNGANNNRRYTKISDILRSLIQNADTNKSFKTNIFIVLDYIIDNNINIIEPLVNLAFKNKNKQEVNDVLYDILFKICVRFGVKETFKYLEKDEYILSWIHSSFISNYKRLFDEYKVSFEQQELLIFRTISYIMQTKDAFFTKADAIFLGTEMLEKLWKLHTELLEKQPGLTTRIYIRNGYISFKSSPENKLIKIYTESYTYTLFRYLVKTYIENRQNYGDNNSEQYAGLFKYDILTISEPKKDNSCKFMAFYDINYEMDRLFEKENEFILNEDTVLNKVMDFFSFPFCIAILGKDIELIDILWKEILKIKNVCDISYNSIPSKYLCLIFYLMIYHSNIYIEYFSRQPLILDIISILIEKIGDINSDYNMLYVALYKLYASKVVESANKITVSDDNVIQQICVDPNIKIRDLTKFFMYSLITKYIPQFIEKYNQVIKDSSTPIDKTFLDKDNSNVCAMLFLE